MDVIKLKNIVLTLIGIALVIMIFAICTDNNVVWEISMILAIFAILLNLVTIIKNGDDSKT